MDTARRNEIAYLTLMYKIRRDGMRVGRDPRRDIGNMAKDLKIPAEEALEFAEIIAREAVDQMFQKKSATAESEEQLHERIRTDPLGVVGELNQQRKDKS